MNWCEINLARDLVYSARKRKRIYWMMIFYLCAAGGLLTITAGFATQRILEGFDYHKLAVRIQQSFTDANPYSSSMPAYAENLNLNLQKNQRAVKALDRALPDKLHTALPLIVSVLNQSDNGVLHRLSFSPTSGTGPHELAFSIRVPASQQSPPEIVQNWQNDEILRRQFSSITPATTHREKIGGKEVLIMSYKAVFRE